MHRAGLTRITSAFALAAVAYALLPALANAQGGPGFLFKQPRVSIKVETGYDMRSASGDVYDQTRQLLTVSRHDFYAPYFGGELAVRVSERLDFAVGIGFSKSRKLSEYRDWVDADDLPIEQTTSLRTVPITLTAKYYLDDRGRSVGRFAWVPSGFTPYVGAGIGSVSYRFEQDGDFVDFEDLSIFTSRTTSAGQTVLVRGVVGSVLSLSKQAELSGELRYTHASAEMSRSFDGFGPMSLGGFGAVAQIGFRF